MLFLKSKQNPIEYYQHQFKFNDFNHQYIDGHHEIITGVTYNHYERKIIRHRYVINHQNKCYRINIQIQVFKVTHLIFSLIGSNGNNIDTEPNQTYQISISGNKLHKLIKDTRKITKQFLKTNQYR